MNRVQHLSQNASLTSTELIELLSNNIYGYHLNGYRAQRWSFSDYMNGGNMEKSGYSMFQGRQEPRIGEWTKMMIKGRGFFTVKDPKDGDTMFTRLGDFHLDAKGNMVTPEGYRVQGTPLQGVATRLSSPLQADPNYENQPMGDINYQDPFHNRLTDNAYELKRPGKVIGQTQDINLAIDPRNGKYLGYYDEIKVDEDGVLYGKDGNTLVSLYKVSVANFNNPEGLKDEKDGVYFSANPDISGPPSLFSGDSTVINEALEKANVWIKIEAHQLTDAQRYFQASSQLHKLADKITGTAIEMIQ